LNKILIIGLILVNVILLVSGCSPVSTSASSSIPITAVSSPSTATSSVISTMSTTSTTSSTSLVTSETSTTTSTTTSISNTGALGSPSNPAPVGTALMTTISDTDVFSSADTYDVKFTVLEVLRGSKAQDNLKAVNPEYGNRTLTSGIEFLLGRIQFEYSARGYPGDRSYILTDTAFTAFSAESREYTTIEVVAPKPEVFNNVFRSGDSQEVWIVIPVAVTDKQPVLIFNTDKWFRLY